MPNRVRVVLAIVVALAMVVVLAGCADDASTLVGGSWTAEDGRTLEFLADGTVRLGDVTAEYEIDGDRILIDDQPVYTSVTWVGEDEFRANETFSPGGAPRLLRFTRSR